MFTDREMADRAAQNANYQHSEQARQDAQKQTAAAPSDAFDIADPSRWREHLDAERSDILFNLDLPDTGTGPVDTHDDRDESLEEYARRRAIEAATLYDQTFGEYTIAAMAADYLNRL